MPIYRSNRPHHVLSRQEKLDLFRDCTVVHPHLKKAYEEFRNLSGQLSRRSIDIHFSRYQADCSNDLIEFQRVLKSFGEKMTLEKAPELEIHWEYFYERSIGCVGILKDWLTQAYRKALYEEAKQRGLVASQQRATASRSFYFERESLAILRTVYS